MYDWHRHTKLQRKFLVKVRTEGKDLALADRELNVTTARLLRWMRGKRFRVALRRAVEENARYARLATKQLWASEVRAIAEDIKAGKVIEPERYQLLDQLQAMVERTAKLQKLERQNRTRQKKKPTVEPVRDLIHPNARHRAREIAAILSRKYIPSTQ